MEHLAGGSLEDGCGARARSRPAARSPGSSRRRARSTRAHAAGRRPPRRQAGEPAARRRRQRARRPTSGSRARRALDSLTQPGNGARHRRLPLARAGARGAGDAGERPLRARRRRVRAAVRRAAVRAATSPTAEAAAHVNAPVPSDLGREPRACRATLDPVFERALAKDPAAPLRERGELVAALRGALSADAGRRASRPAPLRPAHAGGGAAGASASCGACSRCSRSRVARRARRGRRLTRDDDGPQTQQPQVTTVVRTLGTTVAGTTVTPSRRHRRPPPTAPGGAAARAASADGEPSTTRATALIAGGRLRGRAAAAQQAVAALQGSGRALRGVRELQPRRTRLALGRCDEASPYSRPLRAGPGRRKEIDARARGAQGVPRRVETLAAREPLGVLAARSTRGTRRT